LNAAMRSARPARRRIAAIAAVVCALGASCGPAAAMVGGAPAADPAIARHVVLIVGSRGTFCTGVAIARDLVLTAAHCTLPRAGAVSSLRAAAAAHQPAWRAAATPAPHPHFDLTPLLPQRAPADLTLIKLAAPLGAKFVPAPLAAPARAVAVGDAFMVAGYGV